MILGALNFIPKKLTIANVEIISINAAIITATEGMKVLKDIKTVKAIKMNEMINTIIRDL